MPIDLPLIWAIIIAIAVFMYVFMDGFDLGVGILFRSVPDADRDVMMDSVAPFWDGNETWLILGGGGLLVVFPVAYATILPALYIPVMFMLIALIFRGVAFEFRAKADRSRWLWDWSFFLGSVLTTFFQGVILGAFIQGIAVEGRAFVGGTWDWLTPFSIFTGLALISGYALLGATWVIMKTEGDLQNWAFSMARRILVVVIAAAVIVSLWTPFLDDAIFQRWFSWPNIALFSPVPLITAGLAFGLVYGVRHGWEYTPFLMTLGLFLLSYIGLGISVWPNAVPPGVTIWDAAAPDSTLIFMLVGTVILVPVILGYTAYNYWVFRGKVRPGQGYH